MLPTAKKTRERRKQQHWALLPFVVGVTLGLALSTVFLLRPASVTNVYVSLPPAGDDARYAELRRMLAELQLQPRDGGVARLADETVTMEPVYYAVVLSDRHSAEQVGVVKTTWARDVSRELLDFFIPAEEHDEGGEDQHYGEVSEEDGREVVELPTSQLMELQALQYICRHKLNLTKWFFLSHEDVYVKTAALESYLQELENVQDHYGYLGKPVRREPIGRVCLPGPGVILSHSTLARLCPRLEACITAQSEGEDDDTDTVLGACVRAQLPDVQCIKEGQPHDLFLKYDAAKKGALVSPANKHFLEGALTVFPIADPKLMYNIHLFCIGRTLNDSQHTLHQLKLAVDRMSDLLPQSAPDGRNQQRGPASKDDISAWKLISNKQLMSDEENSPAVKTPPLWSKEMELVVQKAMEYLNSWEEEKFSFRRVTNAYWRVEPATAVEYIIDFQVKPEGQEDDYYQPAKHYRATLSRFFNPPEVSPVESFTTGQHVSVAVFLTSDHLPQFQEFMERFREVLEQDEQVDLFVVQMKSPEKGTKKSKIVDTKSILSLYESSFPKASFKVLDSSNLFSRAHGISLVLRELKPSEIVFLADLDLEFSMQFMQRCHKLPLQGQQAFFPIIFSKADPALMAAMNTTHLASSVSHHAGYWLVNSHSVACLYAADILAASQDSSLKGIPGDVDMTEVYRRLIGKGYEVIRSTDQELKRVFASRECDSTLYGEEEELCEVEGGVAGYSDLYTRTELSVSLFDHENSDHKF